MKKSVFVVVLSIIFLLGLNIVVFRNKYHTQQKAKTVASSLFYLNVDVDVSVVVPVYNSEKFIEKAIFSLCNQTLKKMEFIFVDDCSPDNSTKIIQKYALKDKRIRLIHNKKNSGSGPSRNAGIDVANGEYIAFLDPDDWVNPMFYEALYKKATNSTNGTYDIAKGQLVRVKNGALFYEANNWGGYIGHGYKIHEVFIWQHSTAIFKKSILDEHPDARYGSTSYGEDAVFLVKTGYYSNNITFTNDAKYYYYMRPGSLSKGSKYKILFDMNVYLKEMVYFVKGVKDKNALVRLSKHAIDRITPVFNGCVNFKNSTVTKEKELYYSTEKFIKELRMYANKKKDLELSE